MRNTVAHEWRGHPCVRVHRVVVRQDVHVEQMHLAERDVSSEPLVEYWFQRSIKTFRESLTYAPLRTRCLRASNFWRLETFCPSPLISPAVLVRHSWPLLIGMPKRQLRPTCSKSTPIRRTWKMRGSQFVDVCARRCSRRESPFPLVLATTDRSCYSQRRDFIKPYSGGNCRVYGSCSNS